MNRIQTAVGLMSGTSMDGIDAAVISTDGEGNVSSRAFVSIGYDANERSLLAGALEDARPLRDRDARPGRLRDAESMITLRHAEAVSALLSKSGLGPSDVDVIGFHGQTVLHRPDDLLTVQIGDGAELARRTGIPVVSDMRAADIAAGGQGAPLAPAYHRAVAQATDRPRPTAFLNIGGVSNVTWIGPDDSLVAFDTGPGNALLDDWCLRNTGRACDVDGGHGRAGSVDPQRLERLLGNAYFDLPAPKSLDRNDFSASPVEGLSLEDGAATLTEFTARSIANARRLLPASPAEWIVCGGGRRNPYLMSRLDSLVEEADVMACEAIGLDGDAIEAEAFAYLAVRCRRGLPITFPGTTGVSAPLSGGVFNRVDQAA